MPLAPEMMAVTSPGANRIGFLAATQIPLGRGSAGFVAGDFNGDGNLDLIRDQCAPVCSFSVVFGNGDGTFQPARNTSLGAYYYAFYSADLDGDHKDELIVAAYESVDVYKTTDDGSLSLMHSSPTAFLAPFAGRVVDLNGDHILDMIFISQDSNVVTLAGLGDGVFQANTPIQIPDTLAFGGSGPSVVIDDFNGDGNPDFAGIDAITRRITVYLADGHGGFQRQAPLVSDLNGLFTGLAAGDLNGDGKPELIGSSNGTALVFVNDGNGTFSSAASQLAGWSPTGWAVADVNGDSKNDVVVVNGNMGETAVLLGNGGGTLEPPTVGYMTGGYPGVPFVADFNGDGKPDIMVSDSMFNLVYLQGYGDGTFRAAKHYHGPSPADAGHARNAGLATGDVNHDNIADVVVGNCCDAGAAIAVFLGNPDGTVQPAAYYPAADGASSLGSVALDDFDGDGDLDVAASSDNDQLAHIFHGNGDGTFQPDITVGSASYTPWSIAALDLNGDRKPDLALTTYDNHVVLMLNDGEGGFLPETIYSLSAKAFSVAVADVDGDEKTDLIVGENSGIEVLAGNGDGTFQSPRMIAGYGYGADTDIQVADLDRDGAPDLVVANNYYAISVLLGNGDGTFQTVMYPATIQDVTQIGPEPSSVRTADIDGDGNLDLVWANTRTASVGLLYGNGDGTFVGPVEFPTGGYPTNLAIADMNGDGAPDAITSSPVESGVTVLLNAGGNTIQVTASPNPALYGETVTLTATVNSTLRDVTPSGQVDFGAFGAATLTNGTASVDVMPAGAGTQPVTTTYSGNLRPNSMQFSFVVNPATTTTAIASSPNPAVGNAPVTFTAVVTPGTSGVPTGTVAFMDGTATLALSNLDTRGAAAFTTSGLTAGTHSIVAVYGGDTNYAGSTSQPVTQNVLHLPPDYALSADPDAATITGGQSATFTITATADQYFDGTVSLGCGNALPSGVSCSFSQPALTPTDGHPATTTLTVRTTSLQAAMAAPASGAHGMIFLASLGGVGGFGALLLGGISGRKRLSMVLALVLIAIVTGMTACGGNNSARSTNPHGTPLGRQTVQVIATATAGTTGGNTAAHSLSITINIQK